MTTRQIVHDILRDYPSTRDSDEELLLIYEYLHGTHSGNVNQFIRAHYFFIANHIRERAYWQNTKGMFPPTNGVKQKRRKKQAEVVQAIRREKQSFAQNVYSYARRLFDKN